MFVFELPELLVELRECPDAVAGRIIFSATSAVREDMVATFKLFCLWWPLSTASPSPFFRPFISKGPGAIVFILCKRPPLVAVLGLIGAYIGSMAAGFIANPPLLFSCWRCGFEVAGFVVGKGGNAQSRFEESSSGDGGRFTGAVLLRIGFPKGDRGGPSLGVMGETLREGVLAGVN